MLDLEEWPLESRDLAICLSLRRLITHMQGTNALHLYSIIHHLFVSVRERRTWTMSSLASFGDGKSLSRARVFSETEQHFAPVYESETAFFLRDSRCFCYEVSIVIGRVK